MKLLVKIIKCSQPSFWYHDQIGDEFWVIVRSPQHYQLGNLTSRLIDAGDCEILRREIHETSFQSLLSAEKELSMFKAMWAAEKEQLAALKQAADPYQSLKKKNEAYVASQHDAVNKPAHYTDGKIEVIDFIEDKELNFHKGNAVKYIARAGKKDPAKTVEDLKKARWYIDREIERLQDEEKHFW